MDDHLFRKFSKEWRDFDWGPKMRDKAHYLDMLDRNPNASIGISLATKMVMAAMEKEDDHTYREVFRHLKAEYGETMNRVQVRWEMGLITSTERLLPLHPKVVKVEIK